MASACIDKAPMVRESEYQSWLKRAYFEMVVNASRSLSQTSNPDPEDIEKMVSIIKASIADLGGDGDA